MRLKYLLHVMMIFVSGDRTIPLGVGSPIGSMEKLRLSMLHAEIIA
jgi:hypothetical protein